MISPRDVFVVFGFLGALVLAACRETSTTSKSDSLAVRRSIPPVPGSAVATGWDSAAGQVLLLTASSDPTDAFVVLPGLTDQALASTSHFDLGGLDGTSMDLFNQQGFLGSSTLHELSQPAGTSDCISWPRVRLTNPVSPAWKIGIEKGRATGIQLVSLTAMKGADSTRFITDVLNTAKQLAVGDSAFRGLPFSISRGYRVSTAPLAMILAEVVRKINEEANPREEHILFLAEKQVQSNEFRIVFSVRSAGPEESLETSDALAAVNLTALRRPAIVITFEYEDGNKIGLLEPVQPNIWKIIWKSAYAGC